MALHDNDADANTSSGRTGADVLIVDADPAYRKLMLMRFQQDARPCHAVASAEQAIEFLGHRRRIRAVVLDYDAAAYGNGALPKMVKTELSHTPIVGTSTTDRAGDFRALGVDSFLRKPWNERDLAQVLDD